MRAATLAVMMAMAQAKVNANAAAAATMTTTTTTAAAHTHTHTHGRQIGRSAKFGSVVVVVVVVGDWCVLGHLMAENNSGEEAARTTETGRNKRQSREID